MTKLASARRILTATAFAVALSATAAAAASADPQPFAGNLVKGGGSGLSCVPVGGPAVARLCKGTPSGVKAADQRVKSFDDQPIDADVTLPPTGDGPWPLVIMIHGYAGSKQDFESSDPDSTGWNNIGLAKRGYAVLNYSTRGFGASCGSLIGYSVGGSDLGVWLGSLLSPPFGSGACADERWLHLADARYEGRDAQTMAGFLADEGIAEPAVGVTGESYGAGHSLVLARLKDRIMKTNGTTEPWTSPDGTPMRIAAAAPIWPWSDLRNALLPNGRSLDTNILPYDPSLPANPIGVKKDDWVETLYVGGAATGSYAPKATPDCSSMPLGPSYPDLTCWLTRIEQGEPYIDGTGNAQAISNEVWSFHSAMGVWAAPGIDPNGDNPPAPTYIINGWTDDLFPPIEGLRFHERSLAEGGTSYFTAADVGHPRGQNKDDAREAFEDGAGNWFDHFLKGQGATPANGVRAFTQTCPKDAPSGGPFTAPNWRSLAAGNVSLESANPQTVDALGGRQSLSSAIDPNPLSSYSSDFIGDDLANLLFKDPGDACRRTTPTQEGGVATYKFPAATGDGYTMLGMPTIEAEITTHGADQVDGELAGRLWDFDVKSNTQTLVSKGVYRLDGNQSGAIVFQLQGNGWKFEPGHKPKIELLGRDDYYETNGGDPAATNPVIGSFRRSNNLDFTVDINSVKISLPTREPLGVLPPAPPTPTTTGGGEQGSGGTSSDTGNKTNAPTKSKKKTRACAKRKHGKRSTAAKRRCPRKARKRTRRATTRR